MAFSSEAFTTAYHKLLVIHLRHLLNISTDDHLSDSELRQLIISASEYALEDRDSAVGELGRAHEIAYNVVTRLFELDNDTHRPVVAAVGKQILARIGNFPQRRLIIAETGEATNYYLQLEIRIRRIANSVKIRRKRIIFTDFQKDIFDKLSDESQGKTQVVSISAPTSAGKSYSVACYLNGYFENSKKQKVVYLVPTRALIRQVSNELRKQFRREDAEIALVSSVSDYDETLANHNVAYVLTQERLFSLLKSHPKFKPDLLIVDEAQELGSGSRGILLQSAIEYSRNRNSKISIVFLSPPLRNPEVFSKSLRFPQLKNDIVEEKSSPVGQNIILLKAVSRKPTLVEIGLLSGNGELPIGKMELPFSFRDPKCISKVAKHFTGESEVSIIYCNWPSLAEGAARELSEQLDDKNDPVLDDFAKFVADEVHEDHPLVVFLKKGVAFHYGNLPAVIRSRVEKLAEERKIQFICCTSTLLQGVNLPARNLFICNPKKGKGTPMPPADFWNLAGRAGRMAREFHGEVYCLFPSPWSRDVIKEEREYTVAPAFEDAIAREHAGVLEYARNTEAASEGASSEYEHVFGKFYSDFILSEVDLGESGLLNEGNKSDIAELEKICRKLESDSVLDRDLYKNNPAINPRNIDDLANRFEKALHLDVYLPIHPFTKGGFHRNAEIFEILEEVFFKTGMVRYKYYAWLAHRWMTGEPFSLLLKDKIEWEAKEAERTGTSVGRDREEYHEYISKCARDLMSSIDNELRYKYVKYLSCYEDVLAAVLRQRGQSDLISEMLPLHNYIEFGACDPLLISLMSIGLSRSTAIRVKRILDKYHIEDSSRVGLLKWLGRLYTLQSALPETSRLEIAGILGL